MRMLTSGHRGASTRRGQAADPKAEGRHESPDHGKQGLHRDGHGPDDGRRGPPGGRRGRGPVPAIDFRYLDGGHPHDSQGRARARSQGPGRVRGDRPTRGALPRLRFDIVLNTLVAWAFTSGKVLLKSDGTPWRPIAHIEDISRAFLAVLAAPREVVRAQAFNVGRNDQNYRIREIAEIVKETVPGCEIAFADGAGPDKRNYRADFSKVGRGLPSFQQPWAARKS